MNAIAQYDATLQLDPYRGDADDHAARVLWSENRQSEAIARWRSGLAAFRRSENRGVRLPEAFWGRVEAAFRAIGERQLVSELEPDIESLLRDYIHHNAAYRLGELIRAASAASLSSGQGLDWLLSLGADAPNTDAIIDALALLPDLTAEQRIALERARVSSEQRDVNAAHGWDRQWREGRLLESRLKLIGMLLDAGDVRSAEAEWVQIPDAVRKDPQNRERVGAVEIRLAARSGALTEHAATVSCQPGRGALLRHAEDGRACVAQEQSRRRCPQRARLPVQP